MENKKEFVCEECGWNFPEQLVETYVEGKIVYCEKCGKEIVKEILQEKERRISRTSDSIKKVFSKVRKRSVVFKDKVKQRIKELREKYDKD